MGKFNSKGITLIALVITIIVLLILAGVSINVIFGNEGILAKAQLAKIETEKSKVQEALDLWLIENKGKTIQEIEEFTQTYTTQDVGNEVYAIKDLSKINTSSTIGKGSMPSGNTISTVTDLKDLFIIDQENKVSYIGKDGKLNGFINEFKKVVGSRNDWEIDDATGTITAYIGKEVSGDTLVVPNYVENVKVNKIGNGSNSIISTPTNNTIIKGKKLVISNGIKEINAYAFAGCSGFVGGLTIPNSITKIGKSSFVACSGFTENLTIGTNVSSIEEQAFASCSNFSGNVAIGNNVKSIGSYAFAAFGASNKNDLTLYINMKDVVGGPNIIPHSKFKSVVLGGNVETIGDRVFSYCDNITDLNTNACYYKIKSIGNEAFYGCTGLSGNLKIGTDYDYYHNDKKLKIGDKAFYRMRKLKWTRNRK